jgi:phage gp29-like protein
MQLAATLNRDLVRPLVALNRGPQAAYPRLKLMEPESHDAQQVVSVAAAAATLGLRISKADVLKKTGLKEAADDDDAIPSAGGPAGRGRPSQAEASAEADPPPPRDAVDELVDEMLAEWEPAMRPLVEPIVAALRASSSVEEFRARLPAAIEQMDTARLQALLARGGYEAALKGAAGEALADLDDDDAPPARRA